MPVRESTVRRRIGTSGVRRAQKERRGALRTARTIHVASFLGALFLMGILSLVLPKQTYSELEKRELAKLPEFSLAALAQGRYTKDLEFHYADTFPLRDKFVSFAAWLDEWRGVRFDGVRIHGTPVKEPEEAPAQAQAKPVKPADNPADTAVRQSGPDTPAQSQSQVEEEPEKPLNWVAEDDGATGEQLGAVFVYKDKAMSMFGGSDAMSERYAGVISAYQKAWGDEVRVFNIVIPTAIEFSLPERYRGVTAPQKPNIDHIYEMLTNGVVGVDAFTAIAKHRDEYLYFNADHHWTALGAYYAYGAYAQAAGLEPLALSDFEKHTITEFKGTMYAHTNDAKLGEDYVDYYVTPMDCTAVRYDKGAPQTPIDHSVWAHYAKGVNSYSVFFHGDFPLVKVSTENKNGHKALVVKESFGNAFAPYLISHYEEVHVVDQRYFELNLIDYVRENGIDDVVFINNIFAANTKYHIDKIEGMMFAGNIQ
ncbi:MAG: hypothetical protein LBV27_00790 [Oscillospiraceae bacterium]|nr:hypothetical protein [Oscillospiraceae bacterium]